MKNFAFEVYGDLPGKFKEVRVVEVSFAVANWAKVKGSKALDKMQHWVEKGKMRLNPLVGLSIARRL